MHLQFIENTIKVSGNLDNQSIVQNLFRYHAKKLAEMQTVCLDFSNIGKIDSAGLAWIVNAIRDAKQAQVTLTLLHLPNSTINLARLSNCDTLLIQAQQA